MNEPLRVLLVPDVPYWICGTIARAIAAHAPGIEATICSGRVLRSLPNPAGLAGHFDVVHFLTPQDANKSMDTFCGRVATVATIHHVQDESSTQSVARADGVMTASQQWYGHLRALGVAAEKLSIVPYGINPAVFRPSCGDERNAARARLGLLAERFTIGFVGKRSSDAGGRKGTDTFVNGIQELARAGHAIQVLVIGPGWDSFASSLRNTGVSCVWKPFVVGDREFAAMYHAMDAYWCTSAIEGGPVPVLEAMASGLCCLATDVGMVSELVRDGENGFLMPFNDAGAFADCTAALMNDQARCVAVARSAAETIRSGYRWEQSAAHSTALYAMARRNFSARTDRLAITDARQPWPAAWIASEEERLTRNFLRDAHHPPNALGRAWRDISDNRWVRKASAWIRMR